jgi:SAM-dependent methyltransferase
MSEVSKYLSLIEPYCRGCGIDVGSQGAPAFPWLWQLDLPEAEFEVYNGGAPLKGPVQLRGRGEHLPVESNSLDVVVSSHLLEDFEDWTPLLAEWIRVIKPGGFLVVLIPDKELWAQAMARGQMGNPAHRHEGRAGELTEHTKHLRVEIVRDSLTQMFPNDYSILFIAKKV